MRLSDLDTAAKPIMAALGMEGSPENRKAAATLAAYMRALEKFCDEDGPDPEALRATCPAAPPDPAPPSCWVALHPCGKCVEAKTESAWAAGFSGFSYVTIPASDPRATARVVQACVCHAPEAAPCS